MGSNNRILDVENPRAISEEVVLFGIVLAYSILIVSRPAFTGPVSLDPAIRHYILMGDIGNLIHNVVYWELSPPGWHIISYVLIRLSPLSPILTLNIFNLILISGAIISTYLCISRIHTRKLGLLAAFLFPANYTLLQYTTRADHYVLFAVTAVFITTAAVYATSSTRTQGGTNRQLIIYSVLILVSGLTHYYSGILIAVVGLAGLHTRLPNRQALFRWIAAHVPLFISYLFWMPKFYFQYQLYLQRFGTEGASLLPLGPAESITPVDIVSFFPDNIILVVCLLFLTLLTASVVLIGSTAIVNPEEKVIILATFGAVFGILIVDIAIGSGGGRYALQAVSLVPLGVAIGTKKLYVLSDKLSINLNSIIILIIVFVILFYSGGIAQYAVSGGEINSDGAEYVKAADNIDNHMESAADQTVVLSTLHVGEGVLKYYNSKDYEVHGVPKDAFDQRRMSIPVHTNQIYNANNSQHRQRLDQLVNDKRYVIVFLAHADTRNRYSPVQDALRSQGYKPIEGSGSKGAGYVIFEK